MPIPEKQSAVTPWQTFLVYYKQNMIVSAFYL